MLKELWYLLGQKSVSPPPNCSEICLLMQTVWWEGGAADVRQQELCQVAWRDGTSRAALQSCGLGNPHLSNGNSSAEVKKGGPNLVPGEEQHPKQTLKVLKAEALWV